MRQEAGAVGRKIGGSRRQICLTGAGLALLILLAFSWISAPASAESEPPLRPSDSDATPETRIDADSPVINANLVADGFDAPVFLTEPDDGTGRLFIVDQVGQIKILDSGGALRGEPFLDLSEDLIELDPDYDERGLLGLAFHPDYRENRRFFVYYSAPLRDEGPEDWDNTSVVAEYTVSDDPDVADPDSRRVVLEVDQPFSNHNAGQIMFGQDGYLYIPLGDGGDGGDTDPEGEQLGRPPRGNAQTPATLLGSVLRIDVDGDEPYSVPEDNPLVGEPEAEEIFAYGLRNPYGLSLDLETGDIYTFEAGQALYEEVNRIEPGANFGWNIREGLACFNPEDQVDPPEECPDTGPRGEPLVDPVVVYQRTPEDGSVVVPGVMYRGSDMPEYRGRLLFGDYSRIRFVPEGVLYVGDPEDGGPAEVEQLRIGNAIDRRADGALGRFLLGINQDLSGEAYALTTERGGPAGGTGEVFALSSAGDTAASGTGWLKWVAIGLGIAILGAIGLAALDRSRRTK
jgi:glucose/arabinose dehydrogenase